MALPKYTQVNSKTIARSLSQRLIPVADRIRDLYTRFGMRPYRARIIRIRWSGDMRGVGTPLVEKSIDLLPTPLVLDMSTMTEIVQPVGLDEVGTILMTEISGKFTDYQLRFLYEDGREPEKTEEIFYEIEFPKPDGSNDKRRFYLRSAPHYFAGKFMWQVRLEKAHQDRASNGDVV